MMSWREMDIKNVAQIVVWIVVCVLHLCLFIYFLLFIIGVIYLEDRDYYDLYLFLKSFIKRTISIFGSLRTMFLCFYIIHTLMCLMLLYWIFIKCFKSLDTSPIRVSVKYPKSISIRYVKQIELSVLHRFGYFTNTYWRSIQEYRYRIRIQIREANWSIRAS